MSIRIRWVAAIVVVALFTAGVPVDAGTNTYDAAFVGEPVLSAEDFDGDDDPDAVVVSVDVQAYRTDFFSVEGWVMVVDADGAVVGPGSFGETAPTFIDADSEEPVATLRFVVPGGRLGNLHGGDSLRLDFHLYRADSDNQVGHLATDVPVDLLADLAFPPIHLTLPPDSVKEATVDEDGDGATDWVTLQFDVEAARPGLAVFWYELGFDDGTDSRWLRLDPEWEGDWLRLAAEPATVTVRLPGAWMGSTGHDGAWTVTIASFFSETGNDGDMFWTGNLTHETEPYSPDDFDDDGPVTFSDPHVDGLDPDADGFWDDLQATVDVDGELPDRLLARVVDDEGHAISQARSFLGPHASPPHTAVFVFDSQDFRASTYDGPLHLEVHAVRALPESDPLMAVGSWLIDQEFSPADFEPRRVEFTDVPTAQPVDADAAGLFHAIEGHIPVSLNGASSVTLDVSLATVASDGGVRRVLTRSFSFFGLSGDEDTLPYRLPAYSIPATEWDHTYRVIAETNLWPADTISADFDGWEAAGFAGSPVRFDDTSISYSPPEGNPGTPAETLVVTVDVDVDVPGTYEFEATIAGRDTMGLDPWRALHETRMLEVPADASGGVTIDWEFDGAAMHNLADAAPMPVHLTAWRLQDAQEAGYSASRVFLDAATGETPAYAPADFVAPDVRLEAVTAEPVDADGDDLYDQLEVVATVVATDDAGFVVASLGRGDPETGGPDWLAFESQDGIVSGSNDVSFVFDGRHLASAEAAGDFWVDLHAYSDSSPSLPNLKRVLVPGSPGDFRPPGPDAHEPDDTPTQARLLEPRQPLDGNLFPYPNPDWFAFDATAGTTYLVKAVPAEPDRRPGFLEAGLIMYGPDDRPLAAGNGGATGPRILWTAEEDGTHHVKALGWNLQGLDFETAYAVSLIPDAEAGWTWNEPPQPEFATEPGLLAPGESVTFMDESIDVDGAVVAWAWDFGDGNTSTEPNAEHVYATNGTYDVKLRVTDDEGDSASTTHNLVVEPYATVENLTVEAWDPNTLNVTFDTVAHGLLDAVTTRIFYGEEGDGGTISQPPAPPLDPEEVSGFGTHSVLLSDLEPARTYFVSLSTDVGDAGLGTIGHVGNATTPGEPALVGVAAANATPVGVTIDYEVEADHDNWSSFVRYGPAADELVNTTQTVNGTGVHAATLDGLDAETTYHYQVVATMGDYENATTIATFDTLPIPPAPTLTEVVTANAAATTVRVAWTLSGEEAARSRVAYNTSAAELNETGAWRDGPGDHNVTLTGLAPNTTYHFKVVAEQLYGPGAESDVGTFTTTLLPPGEPTDPGVVDVEATEATVTWTVADSDYPMDHRILVREAGGSVRAVDAGSGVGDMSHRVEGLRPNATYRVKVNVTGDDRVPDESDWTVFRTPRLVLPAVQNLTVTPVPEGALLAWSPPADAAGYLVWRSQSPTVLIQDIVGRGNTTHLDTAVNASVHATYIVTYYTNETAAYATGSASVPPTTEGHVTMPAGSIDAARAAAAADARGGVPWFVWLIIGLVMVATAGGAAVFGARVYRAREADAAGAVGPASDRVAWTPVEEPHGSLVRSRRDESSDWSPDR